VKHFRESPMDEAGGRRKECRSDCDLAPSGPVPDEPLCEYGRSNDGDGPTTATVNDGDRPGLEGTGNEFSPQRSYTGREPDPSTGLIYYRARWFDPRIGRFISEEPIGFAAGDTNLSCYVGNSTPNAVDPSGLEENAKQPVGLFNDDPDHTITQTDARGHPSASQS